MLRSLRATYRSGAHRRGPCRGSGLIQAKAAITGARTARHIGRRKPCRPTRVDLAAALTLAAGVRPAAGQGAWPDGRCASLPVSGRGRHRPRGADDRRPLRPRSAPVIVENGPCSAMIAARRSPGQPRGLHFLMRGGRVAVNSISTGQMAYDPLPSSPRRAHARALCRGGGRTTPCARRPSSSLCQANKGKLSFSSSGIGNPRSSPAS